VLSQHNGRHEGNELVAVDLTPTAVHYSGPVQVQRCTADKMVLAARLERVLLKPRLLGGGSPWCDHCHPPPPPTCPHQCQTQCLGRHLPHAPDHKAYRGACEGLHEGSYKQGFRLVQACNAADTHGWHVAGVADKQPECRLYVSHPPPHPPPVSLLPLRTGAQGWGYGWGRTRLAPGTGRPGCQHLGGQAPEGGQAGRGRRQA
jgi:hypothetical protein